MASYVVHVDDVAEQEGSYPAPFDREKLSIYKDLGVAAGSRSIGFGLERLPPGRRTSFTHAHSHEEELVYVLGGTCHLRVIEPGAAPREIPLRAGHAVSFPAGTGIAHTFVNHGREECSLLVVGERRRDADRVFYPDDRPYDEHHAKARPAQHWTPPHANPAVAAFRALHASGCFVLPNPWDVGSALFLQRLGFKALTTTSAGFAFSKGLPDTPTSVPRDVMLAHLREMAAATTLPMNGDFQAGYADEPERLAANVTLCIQTGVAGLSIEDATGIPATPLHDRALAVERIRAARAAIDASGVPVVLTARCEAWLVGDPDPLRTAIDRMVAFAEAGADCLFPPGVRDPEAIAAIVKAVAPKPVNIMVSWPAPALSVSRLADLGVRRISVGSALARVAWGSFMGAARRLAESGSFDGLAEAASFRDLDEVFQKRG